MRSPRAGGRSVAVGRPTAIGSLAGKVWLKAASSLASRRLRSLALSRLPVWCIRSPIAAEGPAPKVWARRRPCNGRARKCVRAKGEQNGQWVPSPAMATAPEPAPAARLFRRRRLVAADLGRLGGDRRLVAAQPAEGPPAGHAGIDAAPVAPAAVMAKEAGVGARGNTEERGGDRESSEADFVGHCMSLL